MERRLSFGLAELQYLMPQLGPAVAEIHTVLQEDAHRWVLGLDDGLALQIDWQAQPPGVRMRYVIDDQDDTAYQAVHAALLTTNLTTNAGQDQTSGLRLSVSEGQGTLHLLGESEADHLSLVALCHWVSVFAGYARRLRAVMAATSVPMPPMPPMMPMTPAAQNAGGELTAPARR